jgi:hypothetical protein
MPSFCKFRKVVVQAEVKLNTIWVYRPIWVFWVFNEPEVAEDGSG